MPATFFNTGLKNMLISTASTSAPAICIVLAIGEQQTPLADFNIQIGYCSFSNELVDAEQLFEFSELIGDVAFHTLERPDEDEDDEGYFYSYTYREVMYGHEVEFLVTTSEEVIVCVDGELDRMRDVDPRKGASIIRRMRTVFQEYVEQNPGKTLICCPHENDGAGKERRRFFERIGFAINKEDDGFSLFFHT